MLTKLWPHSVRGVEPIREQRPGLLAREYTAILRNVDKYLTPSVE